MITKIQVVSAMRLRAAKGVNDGTNQSAVYLHWCTCFHKVTGTQIIFTRDVGHHTCGWFKNPDYERCYHLSLSYVGIENRKAYNLPHNKDLSYEWVKLFFGDNVNLLWVEPPYSDEGKKADVYHYRLFCDEAWQPIKPRGEVYSKELTEKGWKSYSEIHCRNRSDK